MGAISLLLLTSVALSLGAPPVQPIVDSPETDLWNSLDKEEQMAVVKLAFSPSEKDLLQSPPKQLRMVSSNNKKLDSPEVKHLATKIFRHTSRNWKLTPDEIKEIKDTGRLCNDKKQCIDFGGNWGHGCCPFG